MIFVIATIDLAPGTRDAFLEEFNKLVPRVHAEAGCIAYGPAVDADTDIPTQFKLGPDRVTVIGQWNSVDEFKAHTVAPHMNPYRTAVKDYVLRIELRVLSPS